MPQPVSTQSTERFAMVKKRHAQTFAKAVAEQKADPQSIPLCRFLTKKAAFFTSSSCSGRIMLLNVDSMEQKQEAAFLYKKHGLVRAATAWKQLQAPTRNEVWLKAEPFILHLGTDSLENANELLSCARQAGIKRGGIMLAKTGKFMLELCGTQHMSVPVKVREKILVDQKYFGFLIKRANEKLTRNYADLTRFERALKQQLKNAPDAPKDTAKIQKTKLLR